MGMVITFGLVGVLQLNWNKNDVTNNVVIKGAYSSSAPVKNEEENANYFHYEQIDETTKSWVMNVGFGFNDLSYWYNTDFIVQSVAHNWQHHYSKNPGCDMERTYSHVRNYYPTIMDYYLETSKSDWIFQNIHMPSFSGFSSCLTDEAKRGFEGIMQEYMYRQNKILSFVWEEAVKEHHGLVITYKYEDDGTRAWNKNVTFLDVPLMTWNHIFSHK